MNFKRLSAIFVIALMLPFLWFSQGADAQEVCPGINFDNGWLRVDVAHDLSVMPEVPSSQFTAGLYGSLESTDSGIVGGIDWMYNDGRVVADDDGSENTSEDADIQSVLYWSQKNGRTTSVQFTNEEDANDQGDALGRTIDGSVIPLSVHVQIFGEDCVEIRDFCDTYTPKDTHVYDLANLTTNAGQNVSTGTLQGREGFMTITAVVNCGEDDRAIDFGEMFATSRIIDTENDVDYGVNAWHRDREDIGQCFNEIGGLAGGVDEGDGDLGDADIIDGQNGCLLEDLRPGTMSQNFSSVGSGPASDIVMFNFVDLYGPADGIGYSPVPITLFQDGDFPIFLTDIFDTEENLESCPPAQGCFIRIGTDDAVPNSDDFEPPAPPVEDCAVEGDEDGDGAADCADTDCDLEAGCEGSGTDDCTDMMDNDGDGFTDCEDGGCASDPACMMVGDGDGDGDGDGGGSSGCSVASTSSAGTSAAGLLLPMMVFGLGIMVRRMRRK